GFSPRPLKCDGHFRSVVPPLRGFSSNYSYPGLTPGASGSDATAWLKKLAQRAKQRLDPQRKLWVQYISNDSPGGAAQPTLCAKPWQGVKRVNNSVSGGL